MKKIKAGAVLNSTIDQLNEKGYEFQAVRVVCDCGYDSYETLVRDPKKRGKLQRDGLPCINCKGRNARIKSE